MGSTYAGDLVGGRVLDDGDETLKLLRGELTGALVQVDIGLLAHQVGVATTDTLDLGQGVDDLLLAVDVCVEQTQDVVEVALGKWSAFVWCFLWLCFRGQSRAAVETPAPVGRGNRLNREASGRDIAEIQLPCLSCFNSKRQDRDGGNVAVAGRGFTRRPEKPLHILHSDHDHHLEVFPVRVSGHRLRVCVCQAKRKEWLSSYLSDR